MTMVGTAQDGRGEDGGLRRKGKRKAESGGSPREQRKEERKTQGRHTVLRASEVLREK